MELENYHFANIIVIIDLAKNNWWMLKYARYKFGEEQIICIFPKVFPHKLFIHYTLTNFMVGHRVRHLLIQVIKFNITNNDSNEHHMPPDLMHWEGQNITFCVISANNAIPESNNNETDKPKLKKILQSVLYFLKISRSWKTNRQKNCFN